MELYLQSPYLHCVFLKHCYINVIVRKKQPVRIMHRHTSATCDAVIPVERECVCTD